MQDDYNFSPPSNTATRYSSWHASLRLTSFQPYQALPSRPASFRNWNNGIRFPCWRLHLVLRNHNIDLLQGRIQEIAQEGGGRFRIGASPPSMGPYIPKIFEPGFRKKKSSDFVHFILRGPLTRFLINNKKMKKSPEGGAIASIPPGSAPDMLRSTGDRHGSGHAQKAGQREEAFNVAQWRS